MENCQLLVKFHGRNNSSILDVFLLDEPHRLYEEHLSYSTRPPHSHKFAEISLANPSSWVHSFACAQDQIMTFEVACSVDVEENDCNLHWMQDRDNRIPSECHFSDDLYF